MKVAGKKALVVAFVASMLGIAFYVTMRPHPKISAQLHERDASSSAPNEKIVVDRVLASVSSGIATNRAVMKQFWNFEMIPERDAREVLSSMKQRNFRTMATVIVLSLADDFPEWARSGNGRLSDPAPIWSGDRHQRFQPDLKRKLLASINAELTDAKTKSLSKELVDFWSFRTIPEDQVRELLREMTPSEFRMMGKAIVLCISAEFQPDSGKPRDNEQPPSER